MRIIDYIRGAKSSLQKISDIQSTRGGYKAFLMLDYTWCHFRLGCTIDDYSLCKVYSMRGRDRRNFLSNKRRYTLSRRYNPASKRQLCDNKVLSYQHLHNYIRRQWCNPCDCSYEEFAAFAKAVPRFLVKPSNGSCGEGISVADTTGWDSTRLRDLYQQLSQRADRPMVEAILHNHPDLDLGNASLNTLRIITLRHLDGTVEVVCAVLRAGQGDTITDNTATGGAVYDVDLGTGIICNYGWTSHRRDIVRHPGTDIVMPGRQVPYFAEALDMVRRAMAELPEVRWIGWDVAITPDGPAVIEANTAPCNHALQYMHPDRGWYGWVKREMKK